MHRAPTTTRHCTVRKWPTCSLAPYTSSSHAPNCRLPSVRWFDECGRRRPPHAPNTTRKCMSHRDAGGEMHPRCYCQTAAALLKIGYYYTHLRRGHQLDGECARYLCHAHGPPRRARLGWSTDGDGDHTTPNAISGGLKCGAPFLLRGIK